MRPGLALIIIIIIIIDPAGKDVSDLKAIL